MTSGTFATQQKLHHLEQQRLINRENELNMTPMTRTIKCSQAARDTSGSERERGREGEKLRTKHDIDDHLSTACFFDVVIVCYLL
jgi:hypothetical protein